MLIFFYRERVTTGAIRAHAGSSAQLLRVSVFQARRCSSGGSKVKTEARDRDPNVLQLPDDFVTSDDSRGADRPTERSERRTAFKSPEKFSAYMHFDTTQCHWTIFHYTNLGKLLKTNHANRIYWRIFDSRFFENLNFRAKTNRKLSGIYN